MSNPTIGRLVSLALILALGVALLPWSEIRGEGQKLTIRADYTILPTGIVRVFDSWQGLDGVSRIQYPSFSAELGVIPIRISGGRFEIGFESNSFLKQEGPSYYFRSRAYYFDNRKLDLTITLSYPAKIMRFKEASVKPAEQEEGMLIWEFKEADIVVLEVEFDRLGDLAPRYLQIPPETIDPSLLPKLEAHEIPKSFDEVLKDFELLTNFADSNGLADQEFLSELRKIQAKLYYLLLVHGLTVNQNLKPKLIKKEQAERPGNKQQGRGEEPF